MKTTLLARRLAVLATTATLAAGAAAATPTPADAQAFMASLFAGYAGSDPPDPLGDRADTVFAPRLVRLIHRDAAQADGDAGALDYDPICGCQDFALSNVVITIERRPHGAVGAVVAFDNAGRHKTIRFDLAAVHGRWRIADVHDEDVASLVDYLEQATEPPPAR